MRSQLQYVGHDNHSALRITVQVGFAQIINGLGSPAIDTTAIDNLDDTGLDLVEAILG